MTPLTGERIRFFMAFRLNYDVGSDAEAEFFREYEALARLPQIEDFQLMRDVTPPEYSNCQYVVMMEYANAEAHDSFHQTPEHNRFVSQFWGPAVAEYKGGNAVAMDAKLQKLTSPADLAPER